MGARVLEKKLCELSQPSREDVGELLRISGLTQADAARRMCVTRAAVSRWATGSAPMPPAYWAVLRAGVMAELGEGEWPPIELSELQARRRG